MLNDLQTISAVKADYGSALQNVHNNKLWKQRYSQPLTAENCNHILASIPEVIKQY